MPATGPFLDAGCASDPGGPSCELIDKVFFRSGSRLALTPVSYDVPANFVDAAGGPLSAHLPVAAVFSFTTVPEPSVAAPLFAAVLLGAVRACARRRGNMRRVRRPLGRPHRTVPREVCTGGLLAEPASCQSR